jgi:hypothetical protein
MPLYNVFLPGWHRYLNAALITGGAGLSPLPAADQPQRVGLLLQGVNAATPAAAAAAVQATLPAPNQQALMHIYPQANDSTA